MQVLPFVDRSDAGRRLADRLVEYTGRGDVLVLALPRGGVTVGVEVARTLGVQLDVIVVRKLGVPGHEEFAMGAIASGGVRIISDDVVAALGVSDREMAVVAAAEEEELARQERVFRGSRHLPDVRDRTIILVDDGLATGATMRAAAAVIRGQSPARLVVAVPVAPKETCAALRSEVDEVICLVTPEPFHSVGSWYEDFHQTTDEEVRLMLQTR
jgi:putative phosphoribosyl transferase